jgi:hypothetical protein
MSYLQHPDGPAATRPSGVKDLMRSIHLSRRQLRLEILKGALDSLGCLSFGTAMACAGDGSRSASGKVTNWNGHTYELAVRLRWKQRQNAETSWGWIHP